MHASNNCSRSDSGAARSSIRTGCSTGTAQRQDVTTGSAVGSPVDTAERNGINAKLPHFLREQFGLAAIEQDDEEIAAVIEVFRHP